MLLQVLVDILVIFNNYKAYTYFNDDFTLKRNDISITIDETGISWPGDKGEKYKRTADSSSTQWIDP